MLFSIFYFSAFRKFDSHLNRNFSLGLSIAKEIVALHGGILKLRAN
ncbi:hypothetical protein UF72_2663 [Staphylococcus equorum subsp. equorum]|nr:hypothetical protein UF72_2663 [Staphylococcus equorum subsp. equorum]